MLNDPGQHRVRALRRGWRAHNRRRVLSSTGVETVAGSAVGRKGLLCVLESRSAGRAIAGVGLLTQA